MSLRHENQHKYWVDMPCNDPMQSQIGQHHTIDTQHCRCWQTYRVCSRCKCRVNRQYLCIFPQHIPGTVILLFLDCIVCTANCLGQKRYHCRNQCKRTTPPELILYLLRNPCKHCCCLPLACCFSFQRHICCSLASLQHPSPSSTFRADMHRRLHFQRSDFLLPNLVFHTFQHRTNRKHVL